MTKLMVDETLPGRLAGLECPVELCDASGRVVGAFIPAALHTFYDEMEPQISEEELNRREREGGGRTLDEILADLEKRA
jgi:hypothetical protein